MPELIGFKIKFSKVITKGNIHNGSNIRKESIINSHA
jgi:hypothetical protein